uniref:Putative secreted protein n=1 Tax=Anopheles marajoara TaxID=58244 RepID=A0A2M4C7F9_9DIPT
MAPSSCATSPFSFSCALFAWSELCTARSISTWSLSMSAILALLDQYLVHQQPDPVLALQQLRLAVGQLRAQQRQLRLERLLLLPHQLALLLHVLVRQQLLARLPVQRIRLVDLLLHLAITSPALQVVYLRVILGDVRLLGIDFLAL